MEVVVNSCVQIEVLLLVGYKFVFMNLLVLLYVVRDMKLMWENCEVVQVFQQQLVEIVIVGFQLQFIIWVSLLIDFVVIGMVCDVVLFDVMMGYLYFISGIFIQGICWLYSLILYKMVILLLLVINQWQLVLDNGFLLVFIVGLVLCYLQYEVMYQLLLVLVVDLCLWLQMIGSGLLCLGEWSNDIGVLCEIFQCIGMLENFVNIVLFGDVVSFLVKKKSKFVVCGVYDCQLVEGVKCFQVMQGLGVDGVIG